jgi:hypothetical protein
MATVTKESVYAVCNKLQVNNEKATQNSVRKALGGGSFTTIGDFLNEWKDEQKKDHELATTVEVPNHISDKSDLLIKEIWSASIAEADSKLNSERQAFEELKSDNEQKVLDAVEAVKQLELEAEEQNKIIEEFNKKIVKLEKNASSVELLNKDIEHLNSNIIDLKAQNNSLDEKNNSLIEAIKNKNTPEFK